jgi:hypothetical protein
MSETAGREPNLAPSGISATRSMAYEMGDASLCSTCSALMLHNGYQLSTSWQLHSLRIPSVTKAGLVSINTLCDANPQAARVLKIPVAMPTYRSLSVVDERFGDDALIEETRHGPTSELLLPSPPAYCEGGRGGSGSCMLFGA